MGWRERKDKVIEFLKKQQWLLWFLGVSIVLCVAYLFLWVLPKWQVSHIPCLPLKECSVLENEYRKTWAQVLGGIGLFIGIWLTSRRVRATEKTVTVALDSQITERFTKAIEQLGSDKLAVRLGGIYALERIAKDSDKDYWPIMEVLTAYAREIAPSQRENAHPFPRMEGLASNEVESLSNANTQQQPSELAADIQALLTVIGRRSKTFGNGEIYRIDLNEISAIHAWLMEAHLEGALLGGAHLEGAFLGGAHLEGAELMGVHLEGADLKGVHFEKAHLFEAHLEGAELQGAHFEGAFLGGTHLEGAFLCEAHLEGANLCEAHLEGADLRGVLGLTKAQLQKATIDSATKLPEHLKKTLASNTEGL